MTGQYFVEKTWELKMIIAHTNNNSMGDYLLCFLLKRQKNTIFDNKGYLHKPKHYNYYFKSFYVLQKDKSNIYSLYIYIFN